MEIQPRTGAPEPWGLHAPQAFIPGLISMDSAEGQRLLREAGSIDYAPLARYFEGQERMAFCGVASSVIALNALLDRDAHSQDRFFTPEVAAIRAERCVEESGMTLAELGAVLSCHGVRATVHHAGEQSVEQFRERAVSNLAQPGDFLIVNYLREAIGQFRGGHFSPLAAWHRQTDRFLILDVADFKYPPVWVRTEALFAAMASIDAASGRSRGYVTLSLNSAPTGVMS
jgi:hypothetical protein